MVALTPEGGDVCGICQCVPGWYKNKKLREALDPNYEDDYDT